MPLTDEQLTALKPYLVAFPPPEEAREVDMFCPLHDDGNRSASLDLERGLYHCHAKCGGGSVRQLMDWREDYWVPMEGRAISAARSSSRTQPTGSEERVTRGHVMGWHETLMERKDLRDDLFDARGIDVGAIEKNLLGYDKGRGRYTLPIFGPKGRIWNVRRYNMTPVGDQPKMSGLRGRNSSRLYPYRVATALVPGDSVIVCEGEWDALLTEQHGFAAVTRTNGAKRWKAEWSRFFEGTCVYVCHDCDVTGMAANALVYNALKDVAAEVRFLRLPYPIVEKQGKDLTDFWLDNEGGLASSEMMAMMDDAPLWDPARHEPEDLDPGDASVLDTFDSRKVGEPLRVTVTIKGKRDPGYSVPRRVAYSCTQDAGAKCQFCPMRKHDGAQTREIDAGAPLVLEFIDAPKLAVANALREDADIPKCSKLRMNVESFQAVEVLFARPSVDHVRSEDAADYKNMKVLSSGRHDTMPNTSVQVTGALHPNPRHQGNEFLAWDVRRMETSLDSFVLDGKAIQHMRRFQAQGERPMKKLGAISRSLATHVTKIYGRPELHAVMDLVYHSALQFDFAGSRIERGWLDALIVGDTRTGKSEVGTQLARHYRAGEVISCEAASYAGVVGGLQQYGSSKEWAVTWGAIPINDRRLVVLDEVGGLSTEDIARMSSVRSSGTAELTKIQSERTFARTRLIWLGNPRNGRMSDFTYGVQAIPPLIGNAEDIARFDLAMSVVADEVPSDVINMYHRTGRAIYTSEACASLVRWVWSRSPDQIVWVDDAEDVALELAESMGRRYTEDPPLVQKANIRIKIARIAVALAGRVFSTDDEYERIMVRTEHVEDAVAFLDRLYAMRSFGYRERSDEVLGDRLSAQDNALHIERWLEENPGLAKFLRTNGSFRRPDLEEILNVSREEANGVINTLWDARMVRKDRGDIRVEPELHNILRKVNA